MATETVEIRGHIIDSLTLPKVLDAIVERGGAFSIEQIEIGPTRGDPSRARIVVRTESADALEQILVRLGELGAHVLEEHDAQLLSAPADGVLPDEFYVTTNLPTQVRLGGRWVEVTRSEMDKAIVVRDAGPATVPMAKVRRGERVVVGHQGVRVMPPERPPIESGFSFMTSAVSTEKPKLVQTRQVIELFRRTRQAGRKILLVGGPAIIHTGSGGHLVRLVEEGWVDVLFAGNALATHDVEQAIFGTSLGVHVGRGEQVRHGHEHHLRAINLVRAAGGLAKAVETGLVRSGVMHACIRHGVKFVLAGSIRDDGPLPEVITDTLAAQDAMRAATEGVGLTLMVASMLHSVATGNMLPASVTTVAVDINANVVTKLLDRGSWQTIGIVTDVEPFLRELAEQLCGPAAPRTGDPRPAERSTKG